MTIDIPDVLPLSAVEVDRPRRALLVARRDTANEGALGALVGGSGGLCAGVESLGLAGG
jgi:hypothetical protein